MATHMLVQIPVLLLAGSLLAVAASPCARPPRWNLGGVAGLLTASLVMAFWMTPIALDHAAASAAWDAAKALSLLLGGAAFVSSWRIAPPVVHAFFVGNFVWMSVTVGVLYQDGDRRLCNAYLVDDQLLTGKALVVLAMLAGLLWLATVAPFTGQSRRRRASEG